MPGAAATHGTAVEAVTTHGQIRRQRRFGTTQQATRFGGQSAQPLLQPVAGLEPLQLRADAFYARRVAAEVTDALATQAAPAEFPID